MIKLINSKELSADTKADLVCTHCGKEHNILLTKEGVDYVFETDGSDEWCICVGCREVNN